MGKLKSNFSWFVLAAATFILSVMLVIYSPASSEIIYSVINVTVEGNFGKEKMKNVSLIAEMPLTDDSQKILKIYSDRPYALEKGNEKEKIKINVDAANDYSLNFIVEKKIYEMRFNAFNNIGSFGDSKNVEWNEEMKKVADNITKDTFNKNASIETAVKAFKIAKFVHNYLTYDSNSEILSAKDVFKYKKGNCMGYTNLFIAMCRSVGIPARAVGGIAYNNKDFEPHSYAEIYTGEWIPIDPTFFQFPADASHVTFYKDDAARGINVEVKYIGNVFYNQEIMGKFIQKDEENLIDAHTFNKKLTGKNSVMPITVEIGNKKDFYVFGTCKISSKLKADEDEKIYYLSPYEKKNVTFKIFVPELEENSLYFYDVNVRCGDLTLKTNFTVDGDKTGNIYEGVVIEKVDAIVREIYLKNLNEEKEREVVVEICAQNQKEKSVTHCINKSVIIEKGRTYVLKYNLEYPAEGLTLTVKCTGENFSDAKKIFVEVIGNSNGDANIIIDIIDQLKMYQNRIHDNMIYLIAAIVAFIVLALILFKFKNFRL